MRIYGYGSQDHKMRKVSGWESVPGAVPHQGELVERTLSLHVSGGQGLLQDRCPFWRAIHSLDILSTANRLHWDSRAYYRLIKY